MLSKKVIGFIGGGNLAEAIIRGLITSKASSPARILASDALSSRLIYIAENYEVKVYNKNYEAARNADIIFITVKPGDVRAVLKEIAPELDRGKLLISVAAGIRTTSITGALKESGLKDIVPVIRAMPNTPVTVMEGMTALFAGSGAGKEDLRNARAVFESVGRVIVVEDEDLMDAVTGLSGSGPAYIFLVMESLTEAGVKLGLPEKTARELSLQTTLGAAKLALESGKDLAELRRMVTSPGGTTVEGIKRLEEAEIRKAFVKAVEAAAKRARELSGEFE